MIEKLKTSRSFVTSSICYRRYGMLAQSCLAPGFFTLASNMITASDLKLGKEMPRWKQEYLRSSNKVILAETLSPTFVGMTFQEVAHICFATLNLVLVAVEARNRAANELSQRS